MYISDFAIRRPIITVVVMLALVVFGLAALRRLQTDEFPDIDAPIVFVGIAYPGASPEQVEREVVDRLEDRIAGISGLDELRSTSTDGFAQIIIIFKFDKPTDEATQDVRDAISAVRAQLPQEIIEPIVQRFDPSQQPIVSLALTSTTLTPPQLTEIADKTIGGELRAVPGVAQVNIAGADSATLNVILDPNRLSATGVGVDQVVNALRSQNLAAPVGSVTGPITERSIRLEGRLERPEDFARLTVAQRGGVAIPLGQVATVEAGAAERRSAALYNGREAIGIDIVKSKGYSTTQVADGVKQRLPALRKALPAGTTIEIVRDAGERVDRSVEDVEKTLFEGALLTVLVVFLFLNSWRSTVITGLALPVSVLASFVPLWLLGFTLNSMSLLGLSLAIGILIDDAIVVRENIVRHVEMGKDHLTASHEGTDEIGLAVAATTFSIVAVFVPVGFMSGFAGQWFKPFALTIAFAVLVSLFVSFSLDPMLSAYWADPQIEAHERRNPIARALDRFNRWFDRQANRYRSGVAWALDHRWTMMALAALTFFGALFIQVRFGGFGFTPDSDRSELTVTVEAPPGSSLEYTRVQTEQIAARIRTHKEVAYTYATVGSASGSGAVDVGSIYVRLVPKAQRDLKQSAFGRVLRQELRRFASANAYLLEAGGPGGGQKPFQLQLQGPDARTLTTLADSIARKVRSVPGAVDVGLSTKGQKPELRVTINRGLAGTLGVSVGQIAQALRPAFAGVDAGNWVDPSGETRYVRVRLPAGSRENAADLARIPLALPGAGGPGGAPAVVPLGQVADIAPSAGPAQIDHYQRQRVVVIGANIERPLGAVTQGVQRALRDVHLPAGYQIVPGGQVKSQGEIFSSFGIAMLIAVMLMYLILVIQFGSFLDPLAILMSLPLSLIGVVLALLVTRDTLNIMSLIGIILLMGIVAKNAILLIDFAKWTREQSAVPLRDALIEAGAIRLRPILMTTLALIAGMIPVALGLGEGADFRAPLGRAVIGGVITSTLLTLFVIPTVYEIFDGWRSYLGAKLRRRAPAPHGVATPAAEPAGD
ncbi:acriflavin resistance protein [Gemmatirosa kalamazoonensis]|uniref:Acriflavin resistance protein n=1 Tax=Gemmatirosa kalamazoonensis TaxID=861299 RepID=W0R9U0_9BACT|nr:efflux RND transporter permease subunit [Gemmatirosa kalamazoonensis]AHG87874.1 acriflavin resistance protein [Gemmatirosa kalamazoonensis]